MLNTIYKIALLSKSAAKVQTFRDINIIINRKSSLSHVFSHDKSIKWKEKAQNRRTKSPQR